MFLLSVKDHKPGFVTLCDSLLMSSHSLNFANSIY